MSKPARFCSKNRFKRLAKSKRGPWSGDKSPAMRAERIERALPPELRRKFRAECNAYEITGDRT